MSGERDSLMGKHDFSRFETHPGPVIPNPVRLLNGVRNLLFLQFEQVPYLSLTGAASQ
jgi:hypothetical protein